MYLSIHSCVHLKYAFKGALKSSFKGACKSAFNGTFKHVFKCALKNALKHAFKGAMCSRYITSVLDVTLFNHQSTRSGTNIPNIMGVSVLLSTDLTTGGQFCGGRGCIEGITQGVI